MRNLLNNPKFVGALCVLALIMVYFRLFDTKPKYEPPVTPIEVQASPSEPVVSSPEPLIQTAEAAPSSDLTQAQPIEVGWPEELVRDPFQTIRDARALDNLELAEDEREDEDNDEEGGTTKRAMRLHAVFLDGANRVAMINRKLVKEGELVGGYVVDHIQRERVWLKGEEDIRVLEFGVSPKEQPSVSGGSGA